MYHKKAKWHVFAGALLVSSFCGCFGLRVLTIPNAMDDVFNYRKVDAQQSIEEKVSLTLVSESCYACYYRKTDDASKDSEWFMTCNALSVDPENAKDIIKEKADKDDNALQVGLLFADFSLELKKSLERHLAAHFTNSTVQVEKAKPNEVTSVTASLDFRSKWWRTDTKEAEVVLVAEPANGSGPIQAVGKETVKMGNAHLAWMIPLGVGLFPIGFAIGQGIFTGIETGLMEQITAEAMDQSSEKLAAAIAESYKISGCTEWTVRVAFSR